MARRINYCAYGVAAIGCTIIGFCAGVDWGAVEHHNCTSLQSAIEFVQDSARLTVPQAVATANQANSQQLKPTKW
jgi:hypothetical protein